MVGLGRVVGAGGDLVVLWSPGTGAGAAEELVRVLCLTARRVLADLLDARRDVEAALVARRVAELGLDGARDVAAAMTARRDVVETFEAAVRREC